MFTFRRIPLRLRFMTEPAPAVPGGAGPAAAAAPAAPPPPAIPAPPAAAPTAAPVPPAAGEQQPGDGLPDDPTALKAEIARLRRENGAERTNAKTAAATEARDAVLQEFGKALGFIKEGDGALTTEQLTTEATAAKQEARQAAIELAVYRTASKHQGDPDALLDSRTFLAKVAALDPKAEDFTTKVADAIKTAVDENSKLKAAQVARRSSVDTAGGTDEADIDARIAAATAAGNHHLAIELRRSKAFAPTV